MRENMGLRSEYLVFNSVLKGEQDFAELGTINGANHICTKHYRIFASHIYFVLMLTEKKYIYLAKEFPTFTLTQKTKKNGPLPLLYIC